MHTSSNAESPQCCSPTRLASEKSTTKNEGLNAVARISTEEFPPTSAAVRSAGFHLLLQTGSPVSLESLARKAGIEVSDLDAALSSVRDRGRVEFDEHGNLVGIGGLTLSEGRHEFVIDDVSHWTWCALDVVGILGALGATGLVHSVDPLTGEPIDIEYVAGQPTTDVHLFIPAGFQDANVRKDWCPNVNFFSSHGGAEEWAAQHGLEGDAVAVSAILEDAIAMWDPVVGPALP